MTDYNSNNTPAALLKEWLDRALSETTAGWLQSGLEKADDPVSDQGFYVAFGMVPRKLGKATLELNDEDLQKADASRKGWRPQGLSVDQAARLLLTLNRSVIMGDRFPDWLDQLIATGDVAEQVALYRGLPLFPYDKKLSLRAQEGLRTNIKTVFEAIAHDSPFPAEYFEENAWNHMVLKALFIGSALYPIQGIDQRTNVQLTRMLTQYAHERWAAKRVISPELWRCVGRCPNDSALDDLKRVISSSDELENRAAVLALNDFPEKNELVEGLLQTQTELLAAIKNGELTWDRLGVQVAEGSGQ